MTARLVRWIAASSALLWLLGCGPEARLAGGATEAGNAIVAGRILDSSGIPAAGVSVQAFREDHDPLADGARIACPPAVTDSAGRYTIRCRDELKLRLSGRNPGGKRFALGGIRSVAQTRTEAPEANLATPGRLKAWLPDTGTYPGDYVYLPGLPFSAVVDSLAARRGWVEIDSVPAGRLDTVRFRPRSAQASNVLAVDVALDPGGAVSVPPYGLWAHSRSWRLDSAAVPGPGDIPAGFPLLLRLGTGDIDFTRAAADGSDLRCSSQDGAPLAIALEVWDPAAETAVLWVRLDAVPAGTEARVTLHWGRSGSGAVPTRVPVFDTAMGYAGVWHLGEHAAGTHSLGVYRDATPNGFHADDYITTNRTTGHIGYGLHTVRRMWVELRKPPARLLPAGPLTVSAWVRVDSLDDSGSVFAAMEDGWRLALGTDSLFRFEAFDGTSWQAAVGPRVPLGDGRWRHVAAVLDGSTARVYVDGAAGSQVPFAGPIVYGSTVPGFRIGNLATTDDVHDFSGGIDQVEISHVARPQAWIALEHATRKDTAGILIRLP